MLTIRGKVYRNAAAKFWPSFVDAVSERFPDFSRIVLTFPASRSLEADLLHPEREFAECLLEFSFADLEAERRQVLAEMEILGPPASVLVAVQDRDGNLLAPPYVSEELDAEIVPYLLVWLLRWAELPASRWNDPDLRGTFTACDPERALTYGFTLHLTHRALSEGLLERRLALGITMTALV